MEKEYILLLECLGVCLLMFLICFVNTGTDKKNLKSLNSYPDKLIKLVKEDEDYKDKIKPTNKIVSFISNLLMFIVIVFLFGIGSRTNNYLTNFIFTLIIGESINLFDFLIIDLCWFRYTKRTRFIKYQDNELYKGYENHLSSFTRAIFMFILVALIDAGLLLLF